MLPEAFAWTLLATASLPLGAAAGCWLRLPAGALAGIVAFGAGTLIAALSLVLMQEAHARAGMAWSALGFVAGALLYTVIDTLLGRRTARGRRGHAEETGLATLAGATLDNIPEMIVFGTSLMGGHVNAALLAAILVSNFPESLASAAELRQAGRSRAFAIGLWTLSALIAAAATLGGMLVFRDAPAAVLGAAQALAAGAVLAMLVDTLIPEAFHAARRYAGLATALGFLLAFALEKWHA